MIPGSIDVSGEGKVLAQSVTHEEALQAIAADRKRWQALLQQTHADRMNERAFGGGEWNFADLVGHLNGWSNRTVARIEAAARNEPQPPNPWPVDLDSVEAVNDWFYQQNQGQSLVDLLAEREAIYDRLREAVPRLPDEVLNDPAKFKWADGLSLGQMIVSGAFFEHLHSEHGHDVAVWLGAGENA